MRATTDPGNQRADRAGRWKRLAWFVLLYAAGLAVTLLVAYALKALIPGV
jgi:hypothetical protein